MFILYCEKASVSPGRNSFWDSFLTVYYYFYSSCNEHVSKLPYASFDQHLLIHIAAETSPLLAGGTLGFAWTVIAVPGSCSVAGRALKGMGRKVVEFFAYWTSVDISPGVVGELLHAKAFGAMIVIGKGNLNMDVLAFDSNNVLCAPVFAV
jgi:hypothetical protein